MRNQSRVKGDGGAKKLLEMLRCMHSDYNLKTRSRQGFQNVAFSALSGFVTIVGRSDINHVYE